MSGRRFRTSQRAGGRIRRALTGWCGEAPYRFPGAGSLLSGPFVSVAWNRPYGMEDLSVTTFQAGTTAGKAALFLSYSGSGFDLYGDETEKLGISYTVLKGLSCGLRLSRHAMRIKGFGDASAWCGDAGFVFRPNRSVFFAGSFENINNAELGASRESIDGHTRLSVSWVLPGDISIIGLYTGTKRFDPSFSGGMTAELSEKLVLGVAGGNEPDRMEFLATVHVRGFACSYRGVYHRELGMTFGKWRQQLRLLLALEQLASGEKVTNVALNLGYSDVSSFIAMFKSTLGTTPAQYFRQPMV